MTGDLTIGTNADIALEGIRLLMLANDVSLRNLIPAELAKGFGFLQGKPATAFGPVAVTPDELGDAWQGGRVHLTLQSTWNGRKVGMCDAGADMAYPFGQLIAGLAKTRPVRAGSMVGAAPVSNAEMPLWVLGAFSYNVDAAGKQSSARPRPRRMPACPS